MTQSPLSDAGRLIRHRLGEMHWTQARLAAEVGLQTPHLSRMMRGNLDFTADMAVQIEQLTAVNADDIMQMQNAEHMQQIRDEIVAREKSMEQMPDRIFRLVADARARRGLRHVG